MAVAYRKASNNRVESVAFDYGSDRTDILWLDAFNPDDGELNRLSDMLGFQVPNRHDMTEIELSSRLYKRNGAFIMVGNLMPKSATEILPPRPAAFIMREDLLLTIRFCEFYSFERVARDIETIADNRTPQSIFCQLLDEAVSDRADDIEFTMRHLEELTSLLFLSRSGEKDRTKSEPELDDVLKKIGGMGERVANIRESIASLQRILNYARTYVPEKWLGNQILIMDSLKTDLTALSDEAAFFMNKLSFNLDATLGMINIEENKIIRLLSIVTLLLSPPTLIAGIYGMNFDIMPELEWGMGYFFALGLMAGSSLASIWYLRRKRWL